MMPMNRNINPALRIPIMVVFALLLVVIIIGVIGL